ncbi:MAG TPA: cell division protein FtsL, partial [Longimicrobiaceae bacterium]|nr:cell division protein FtsL [Longimicrobiaceae bacterium]
GVVIWRQTRGVALEHGLRELQAEHTAGEADRVELERRIQTLASRARVVRIARERLGMHLPENQEIVFLPMPPTEGPHSTLAAQAPR